MENMIKIIIALFLIAFGILEILSKIKEYKADHKKVFPDLVIHGSILFPILAIVIASGWLIYLVSSLS